MTTNADRLNNRDFILVNDRSGSMGMHKDTPSGQTRWKDSEETTFSFAQKVAPYDPDGITSYFFNSGFEKHDNITPEKVAELFKATEPNGGTALVPVLTDIFENYKKLKAKGETKANGSLVIVITDGEPTDRAQVASLIINFTKTLESREEFGLLFVQSGKDAEASKFLKSLDDDLEKKGAKWDIVDTITSEEVGNRKLEDVIMGALND